LKKILHDRGLSTAVGDEGGFAPKFEGTEDGIETILEAIKKAGYTPGKDIFLAFDCAASEFYKDGKYDYTKFEGPKGAIRTSAEQVEYLASLAAKYPIISIEDPFFEKDIEAYFLSRLNQELNTRVEIKEVSFSLLKNFPSASVSLEQVSADHSKPYKGAGKLLTAEHIDFNFSIWNLLSGNYQVEKISVHNGSIQKVPSVHSV
jgi:hypothetical protein